MKELLRVKELSKTFGAMTAVDGISFTIGEGRCVALLGPNGAGKTTTLKMLSGLLAPTKGSVGFAGAEGGDIRAHIGYLPQYPAFYKWMTAKEYLEYVGKLAGLGGKQVKAKAAELLKLVGVEEARNRKIGGFSGGMKQRLGIAQALIHSPRLVILDEPVSALDPLGRREVLELIRLIKQETTILFSTHVLHDAEEVSDDVLIMQKGRIAISGSLEQVRKEHQQPLIRVWTEDATVKHWANGLSAELGSLVESVECDGREARIQVTDLKKAQIAVLSSLAAKQVPVTKFEIAETSLEDLFMKVVGS